MELKASITGSPGLASASSGASAPQRWLWPGLIAGAVFLAFEMVAGTFTTTTWAFPEGIAQTIGIGAPGYHLQPLSLLVGVIVHLVFSMALGALFIAIARQFRLSGGTLVAGGVVFSWVESAVSIWAVLHTLLPSTLPLLLGAVPFWASFVGRTAYGLILGLLCGGGPFKMTPAPASRSTADEAGAHAEGIGMTSEAQQ